MYIVTCIHIFTCSSYWLFLYLKCYDWYVLSIISLADVATKYIQQQVYSMHYMQEDLLYAVGTWIIYYVMYLIC